MVQRNSLDRRHTYTHSERRIVAKRFGIEGRLGNPGGKLTFLRNFLNLASPLVITSMSRGDKSIRDKIRGAWRKSVKQACVLWLRALPSTFQLALGIGNSFWFNMYVVSHPRLYIHVTNYMYHYIAHSIVLCLALRGYKECADCGTAEFNRFWRYWPMLPASNISKHANNLR